MTFRNHMILFHKELKWAWYYLSQGRIGPAMSPLGYAFGHLGKAIGVLLHSLKEKFNALRKSDE